MYKTYSRSRDFRFSRSIIILELTPKQEISLNDKDCVSLRNLSLKLKNKRNVSLKLKNKIRTGISLHLDHLMTRIAFH